MGTTERKSSWTVEYAILAARGLTTQEVAYLFAINTREGGKGYFSSRATTCEEIAITDTTLTYMRLHLGSGGTHRGRFVEGLNLISVRKGPKKTDPTVIRINVPELLTYASASRTRDVVTSSLPDESGNLPQPEQQAFPNQSSKPSPTRRALTPTGTPTPNQSSLTEPAPKRTPAPEARSRKRLKKKRTTRTPNETRKPVPERKPLRKTTDHEPKQRNRKQALPRNNQTPSDRRKNMAGRVQHEENTGNNVPSRTKPEVRAEKMGAKTPRDFDRWRGVGRVPSAVEFIGEGGLLDHLGEQATEDAIVRFWPGKRGEVIDLLGRLTKTKQLIYDGNTYRRA